jgi:hypothetical protein
MDGQGEWLGRVGAWEIKSNDTAGAAHTRLRPAGHHASYSAKASLQYIVSSTSPSILRESRNEACLLPFMSIFT